MSKPLPIESVPAYWRARKIEREKDHSPHDAMIAAEYSEIARGLDAGRPLVAIPEYKRVSARVATWASR